MGDKTSQRMNKVLRAIAMCYLLAIIPAILIYGGIRLLTDLRGKALFYSFLPVALALVILYLYYLLRPFRFLGWTLGGRQDEEKDHVEPGEEMIKTSKPSQLS